MKMAASEAVYQFEGFVLDLVRGALLDAKAVEVPLRAKSFDLLRLFVTNAGRLLDRDEINKTIWTDVIVTDDAITQCVRDIRRATGDEEQRILKTIPRRGYIFAAAVTRGVDQRLTVPIAEPLPLPDKSSIAVLPFQNLSSDPDQEHFSDGIADDIITELSRSRSLFVIARNSSFTYRGQSVDVKQVACELGVRYVLEGSIRREGARVRVNAQLIEAASANHIWAERYDCELAGVFAIQDCVTSAVATAIQPAIADADIRRILRKSPQTLGAWEAYQRGLWHVGKPNAVDNERAREFFRRAVELDPMFATPYAMMAYSRGYGFASSGAYGSRENQEMAEAEARRALELDPYDPTAHAVLSWWAFTFNGHYEAGLERAEQALAISPNDVSAWLAKGRALLFSGRASAGRAAIQRALRLSPRDPFSWVALTLLAIGHYFDREYVAAVDVAQRTIRAHPTFPLPYRWLAAAFGQLDRSDEAYNALQKAIELSPQSFEFYVRSRPPWHRPQDHEQMLDGLRKAGWEG